jgi:hypothetical protein
MKLLDRLLAYTVGKGQTKNIFFQRLIVLQKLAWF